MNKLLQDAAAEFSRIETDKLWTARKNFELLLMKYFPAYLDCFELNTDGPIIYARIKETDYKLVLSPNTFPEYFRLHTLDDRKLSNRNIRGLYDLQDALNTMGDQDDRL